MITISTCLIVKNEEQVIERCLKSIQKFSDEIIIVDTGSTDNTKFICSKYTDKIIDFTWVDDFSAARNASITSASGDYIYIADADEYIDEQNIKKILELKEIILPEIDVVQMFYTNQLEFNTTYNYDKELRPKLYKRLRRLVWTNPIHESIHLNPVIYDSEIEIIHKPISNHAKRDFTIYYKNIERGVKFTDNLIIMLAKELYIAGDEKDFKLFYPYFNSLLEEVQSIDVLKAVQCVLVKAARIMQNWNELMKNALKNIADKESSSEVCYELGEYYFSIHDYKEANIWYYNAAYETNSILNIKYSGEYPIKMLLKLAELTKNQEEVEFYYLEYEKYKS